MPDMSVPQEKAEKDLSYWQNYLEYNKTLRTWFVSFGVGGPILLIANPSLLEALKRAHMAYWVVSLFLAGCASQVLVAFTNKTTAWYKACGEDDPAFKNSGIYRRCSAVAQFYWIDLTLDLASMVFFAAAVFLLIGTNLDVPSVIQSPPMPR